MAQASLPLSTWKVEVGESRVQGSLVCVKLCLNLPSPLPKTKQMDRKHSACLCEAHRPESNSSLGLREHKVQIINSFRASVSLPQKVIGLGDDGSVGTMLDLQAREPEFGSSILAKAGSGGACL